MVANTDPETRVRSRRPRRSIVEVVRLSVLTSGRSLIRRSRFRFKESSEEVLRVDLVLEEADRILEMADGSHRWVGVWADAHQEHVEVVL